MLLLLLVAVLVVLLLLLLLSCCVTRTLLRQLSNTLQCCQVLGLLLLLSCRCLGHMPLSAPRSAAGVSSWQAAAAAVAAAAVAAVAAAVASLLASLWHSTGSHQVRVQLFYSCVLHVYLDTPEVRDFHPMPCITVLVDKEQGGCVSL
jgi:hypothetical protein